MSICYLLVILMFVSNLFAWRTFPRLPVTETHENSHITEKVRTQSTLKPWPTSFQVKFNVTVVQFNMYSAPSTLYYSWPQRAQRIDLGQCSASGNQGPCSVLFKNSNVYTIQNGQCTVQKAVPTLPPSWTSVLSYNSTIWNYNQNLELWNWLGAAPCASGAPTHHYYVTPGSRIPIALLVTDIFEEWIFTSNFMVGSQDPNLFVIPNSCNQTLF